MKLPPKQIAQAGATDGQVLAWDNAGGKWAPGAASALPACTETSASSSATTTSDTYTALTGMSVTPAAGTYLVRFSASADNNVDSAGVDFALFKAGTIIASSERHIGGTVAKLKSARMTAVPEAKVTVNGSEAVDVRWKRVGSAGTCTVYARTLITLEVA